MYPVTIPVAAAIVYGSDIITSGEDEPVIEQESYDYRKYKFKSYTTSSFLTFLLQI